MSCPPGRPSWAVRANERKNAPAVPVATCTDVDGSDRFSEELVDNGCFVYVFPPHGSVERRSVINGFMRQPIWPATPAVAVVEAQSGLEEMLSAALARLVPPVEDQQ
jgi:hypothetical protein